MLRTASTLKTTAATLEQQAWGALTIATAGANVSRLWDLFEAMFGIKRPSPSDYTVDYDDDEFLEEDLARDTDTEAGEEGEEGDDTSVAGGDTPSISGESAVSAPSTSKKSQKGVTILWPPLDSVLTHDFAIPAKFLPTRETLKGKANYLCPTCEHVGGNRPSICNHVRRCHTRTAIGCAVGCKAKSGGPKIFYSVDGWRDHVIKHHQVSPVSSGLPPPSLSAHLEPLSKQEADEVVAALSTSMDTSPGVFVPPVVPPLPGFQVSTIPPTPPVGVPSTVSVPPADPEVEIQVPTTTTDSELSFHQL